MDAEGLAKVGWFVRGTEDPFVFFLHGSPAMVAPTHKLPRHDTQTAQPADRFDVLGRIGPDSSMPLGRAGYLPAGQVEQPAPQRPTGKTGMDRRIFPRKDVEMRVSGQRLDHSIEARREPVLSFKTQDVSVGGLKATSQSPLQVGERVGVFFPPEGNSRGWDAYGRVVRIEPSFANDPGYTVAVEFEPMMAA